MKEAIVYPGPTVKIVDTPIPKPEPDQVITKVIFSGSNPKDWKVPGSQPTTPPAKQLIHLQEAPRTDEQ